MTSKLKCAFCGGELDTENYYVHCHNPHCNTTVEMEGTEEMWEALIQAKQDLEFARKALKNMSLGNVPSLPDDETLANAMCNYARDTLKQIEHKE